jgi:hypothetical protein
MINGDEVLTPTGTSPWRERESRGHDTRMASLVRIGLEHSRTASAEERARRCRRRLQAVPNELRDEPVPSDYFRSLRVRRHRRGALQERVAGTSPVVLWWCEVMVMDLTHSGNEPGIMRLYRVGMDLTTCEESECR